MSSPKPTRVPRLVREQQMLDAAVSVFARHGYHAASMDEIAWLAGISKPMVYAYLGTKEDLFLACIRREGTRLVAAITAAVAPDLPADEQLWRGLDALFSHVAEHADGWAALYRQARAHGSFADEVGALRERIVDVVAVLFTAAMRSRRSRPKQEDVTALAHALVGAGESLADWVADHPEEASVTATRLMNFAWMGLGDLTEGRVWPKPGARRARSRRTQSQPAQGELR